MLHQTDNLLTVLYLRLSREDENEGDSNSIVNQKELLLRYAQEHGFTNIKIISDDGYSGVSFDRPGFQELAFHQRFPKTYKIISDDGYSGVTFNRPGFQELLRLANAGKVGVIITKDLSRLGRNYIEVGKYSEVLFPGLGIRYIAVNDGFDSDDLDGNELAPFKNLFNEWYARDTSKKIRAVLKSKATSGKSLTNNAPYGYKRGKEGEPHLVIDEETAPVVRRIYQMCAQGLGPAAIASALRRDKILKPASYRYQTTGNYGTPTDVNEPYGWNQRTIGLILENEVYLGHTVNCRTKKLRFLRKDRYASKTRMKLSLIRPHGISFNPSEPINEGTICWERSTSTAVSCIVLIAVHLFPSCARKVRVVELDSSAVIIATTLIATSPAAQYAHLTVLRKLNLTKSFLRKSTKHCTSHEQRRMSLPSTSVRKPLHSLVRSLTPRRKSCRKQNIAPLN